MMKKLLIFAVIILVSDFVFDLAKLVAIVYILSII